MSANQQLIRLLYIHDSIYITSSADLNIRLQYGICSEVIRIDELPVCADWLANLDLGQRS